MFLVVTAAARTSPTPRGERLVRDDYFLAAYRLLAEGGVSALTTTNVCKRLGVTTGSLYHHFRSGAEFYAAFIDRWESTKLSNIGRAEQEREPVTRLEILFEIATTADHDAERAILAWGSSDPMISEAIRRVEQQGHNVITEALVEAGLARATADVMAHIGFCILTGSQQIGERVDRPLLVAALDEYRRWLYTLIAQIGAPDRERALRSATMAAGRIEGG